MRVSFGNSVACSSGDSSPSSDGPRHTPAIISPTTCGCARNLRPSQPQRRQASRITASCRKKWTLKSPGAKVFAPATVGPCPTNTSRAMSSTLGLSMAM